MHHYPSYLIYYIPAERMCDVYRNLAWHIFCNVLAFRNSYFYSDGDDEFIKEIDEKANGQESPESIELLPR